MDNTDLESETTTQRTTSNGSSSTEEQELSDFTATETWLFLTKLDMDTESMLPLLSDHGEESHTRELPSMVDQEETLETMLKSALMFTETEINTTDTSFSGTAIMVSTKPGG